MGSQQRVGTLHSLDVGAGEDNSWQLQRISRLEEVRAEKLFDGNATGQDSDWMFAATVDKELVIWRMNKFRPLRAFQGTDWRLVWRQEWWGEERREDREERRGEEKRGEEKRGGEERSGEGRDCFE